jgi:phage-related protein
MHNYSMKAVFWMGRSKEDLVDFPEDCRREAGYQLERVQRGEEPRDWKPMATVGAGVREIRIHESSGAGPKAFMCCIASRRRGKGPATMI